MEFWLTANRRVRESGDYNFKLERIPVNGKWDFEYLESKLKNYNAQFEVMDMFRFGWPLNAEDTEVLPAVPSNQWGALENPEKIRKISGKREEQGIIDRSVH